MDIVAAENLEATVSKVSVRMISAGPRTSVGPPTSDSVAQLPGFSSSKPATVSSNQSSTSSSSVIIVDGEGTCYASSDMSGALLEPSTVISGRFFPSSEAAVSTAPGPELDSSLTPKYSFTSSTASTERSHGPPCLETSPTFSYANMMQSLAGSFPSDRCEGPSGSALSLDATTSVSVRRTPPTSLQPALIPPSLPSFSSPVEVPVSGVSSANTPPGLQSTIPSHTGPVLSLSASRPLDGSSEIKVESVSSREKGLSLMDVPMVSSVPSAGASAGRSSLEISTTVMSSGNVKAVASTTLPTLSQLSHSITPQFAPSLKSIPIESATGTTPMESRSTPVSSGNHYVIMTCNSDASMGNISPSLLDVRSVKDDGPPSVPSAEALPRRPARGGQKGEGWPYAPQGWPNADDKWPWKVGKRMHVNGYFRDRFLGLPKNLCKGRKIVEFASKKSIVAYLEKNFPHVNVDNFFKSFQWRVPVPYANFRNPQAAGEPFAALKVKSLKRQISREEDKLLLRGSAKKMKESCRAGNATCGLETGKSFLAADDLALKCEVCCTEPRFCRECKCILCCQTIALDGGVCFHVRCLQKPSGDAVCGHAAHLECALRASRAGVVKEKGLDMEYLCRRCDKKTDLRVIVMLLLEMVGKTDEREEAEKCLVLALEVMNGTEHGGSGGRALEAIIKTAVRKVQGGADIRAVFNELKDQGAAAEAAKEQNLGRGASLLDDAQQPEASLDQWLPSSGSPSSHRSPTAPSSFTSPCMRSNPSVNSGHLNGTKYMDVVHKHRKGMRGVMSNRHKGHIADPYTSLEVPSNSNSKHSLANKTLISSAGQARSSDRQARSSDRLRIVSSSQVKTVRETIPDSHPAKTAGNSVPSDGNSYSRLKIQSDEQVPSASTGLHKEDSPTCISGDTDAHPARAVSEDGEKRTTPRSIIPQEHELGGDSKNLAEIQEGALKSVPTSTYSSNGTGLTVMGTSLDLLDSECKEDVLVALQKLRKAQDAEFECAKVRLNAQRELILRQYHLLEVARCQFSEQRLPASLEAFDQLLIKLAKQLGKATEERGKFKTMLKVGDGFGSISKEDLSQLYQWPVER